MRTVNEVEYVVWIIEPSISHDDIPIPRLLNWKNLPTTKIKSSNDVSTACNSREVTIRIVRLR